MWSFIQEIFIECLLCAGHQKGTLVNTAEQSSAFMKLPRVSSRAELDKYVYVVCMIQKPPLSGNTASVKHPELNAVIKKSRFSERLSNSFRVQWAMSGKGTAWGSCG